MKPIDVTCGIIVKGKRILVARRSRKMNIPMKWEFPGGKIKIHETAEQCLHRELKEELNIYVKIEKRLINVVHDYGDFVINLIPFIATFHHGEIKLLEHKEVKWIERDKLNSLDWAAADIAIVKQLDLIGLP